MSIPKYKIKKGLVSVIVPTKNESQNLKTMFTSLVAQTYKNIEIIINDDANTTDDSSLVIESFSNQLNIVHIHDNKSLAHGRLQGSKIAQGEYMLHLDADMELTPMVIESCVKETKMGYQAITIPEVGVGEGFWNSVHSFEKSLYIGDESIESARFFLTSAYWDVGGYNPKMVLSEDKDIDLRIRERGYRVGRIVDYMYHHEKNFSPIRSLKKKFFYGKTSPIFISAHPFHSLKQANLIFRPAFFRNWRKIISHPILFSCLIMLKILETLSGLLGLIFTKTSFLNIDPWRKNS